MNVFVYGTLLPGESRWHALSPYVVGDPEPAQVNGVLFTMGSYPALVLEHPDIPSAPVRGVVCSIRPGSEELVIRILDRIEGFTPGGRHNLYERVELPVTLDNYSGQALSSFYVAGTDIAHSCNSRNHIKSGNWLEF